jgi:hypothetical protein
MVTPESLNRLVASAADDSSIIGICGETKLHNEEGSWWTMIQVYEYYISHNLSKAFESLFGSVTCLPGCFSLYRIRTADKGRPIIISNRIIDEYAEPNVDTLHKKNLFSLGEDRYLTTLLLKHFPTFKTKFCSDAICRTVAPESWRILFSQRRRWINSTVHNLCELAFLPELFGFCCFSMRFFVFIDLLGTLVCDNSLVRAVAHQCIIDSSVDGGVHHLLDHYGRYWWHCYPDYRPYHVGSRLRSSGQSLLCLALCMSVLIHPLRRSSSSSSESSCSLVGWSCISYRTFSFLILQAALLNWQ